MKRIIPHKLVVSFTPDGEVSSAILQYKREIDGATENKFYTMAVDKALDLNGIFTTAKSHVERGEKII